MEHLPIGVLMETAECEVVANDDLGAKAAVVYRHAVAPCVVRERPFPRKAAPEKDASKRSLLEHKISKQLQRCQR